MVPEIIGHSRTCSTTTMNFAVDDSAGWKIRKYVVISPLTVLIDNKIA